MLVVTNDKKVVATHEDSQIKLIRNAYEGCEIIKVADETTLTREIVEAELTEIVQNSLPGLKEDVTPTPISEIYIDPRYDVAGNPTGISWVDAKAAPIDEERISALETLVLQLGGVI